MCRGDISLVTFVWSQDQRLPVVDFTRPHECVEFNSLNEWSGKHSVDIFDPGLLYHPTLGKPHKWFDMNSETDVRKELAFPWDPVRAMAFEVKFECAFFGRC